MTQVKEKLKEALSILELQFIQSLHYNTLFQTLGKVKKTKWCFSAYIHLL